jgi:hypothetical protein
MRFRHDPCDPKPRRFRLASGAATGHGAGAAAPVAGDAPTALPFDHVGGAYQHDPKRLGRFEVRVSGLLDRQIASGFSP